MNHWIKRYRKKQSRFWTAEFLFNGAFALKPRRVGLDDDSFNSGNISMIFADVNTKDNELLDFLSESQKSMDGLHSNLRQYELLDEVRGVCLRGLSYIDFGLLNNALDIRFEIDYRQVAEI